MWSRLIHQETFRRERPLAQYTRQLKVVLFNVSEKLHKMREIVHIQAGQCGNQIGAKVNNRFVYVSSVLQKLMNVIKERPVDKTFS